jgi:uncharacterized protein (DUF305 family)
MPLKQLAWMCRNKVHEIPQAASASQSRQEEPLILHRANATRPSLVLLFVLAALAAVSHGCASAAGTAPDPASRPSAGTAAELEALFRARTDSARTRFTEADVHFMSAMIGHHAQALVMAGLAPGHGASPTIQTLAARIINAQQDEIATMQRWLREREQPVPEVHIHGLELMIHGADHVDHAHMPGMLSPEQLSQLDRTHGPEFDRLFLELMIQHHQGAVTMVDQLFATDGAAQDPSVFKLASDIQVDQRTEIARMQRMLQAMSEPNRVAPH